jgi:hypothetical protein
MPPKLNRYKAEKHGKEVFVLAKTAEQALERIHSFQDWDDIELKDVKVAPDEE